MTDANSIPVDLPSIQLEVHHLSGAIIVVNALTYFCYVEKLQAVEDFFINVRFSKRKCL